MVTKILIVDDSSFVRQKVAACFESENYALFQSENAQSAINMLRTEQDFSLMILDVNMPGPSGLQLVKFLNEKNNPQKPALRVDAQCHQLKKINA